VVADAIATAELTVEGTIDSSYIIGPGDYFGVFTEERSATVRVSPEGGAALEGLGAVQVGGLSLAEARRALRARLETRYRPEFVAIELRQLKSVSVPLLGAVKYPGSRKVQGQVRLSALLTLAGGFLPWADRSAVRLVRANGDTVMLDLFDAARSGSFDQDPLLMLGDQVHVPYLDPGAATVSLRLGKGKIVLVPWHGSWSLRDYLQYGEAWDMLEGGGKVRVSSPTGVQDVTYEQLGSVKPAANSLVEPISVPQMVYVGGAVRGPGPQQYDPSWRILDYLGAAGVEVTAEDPVEIRQVSPDGTSRRVDALSAKALPGDYYEVNKSTFEYVKDWSLIVSTAVSILSTIVLINVTLGK